MCSLECAVVQNKKQQHNIITRKPAVPVVNKTAPNASEQTFNCYYIFWGPAVRQNVIHNGIM